MAGSKACEGRSQLCPDQGGAIISDWQQLAGNGPLRCQAVLLTHPRQAPTLTVHHLQTEMVPPLSTCLPDLRLSRTAAVHSYR